MRLKDKHSDDNSIKCQRRLTRRRGRLILDRVYVLSENNRKAPVNRANLSVITTEKAFRPNSRIEMPVDVAEMNEIVSVCRMKTMERTHQCRIHGPGLSVVKRMVTFSGAVLPMLTTSRLTGFS